MSKEANEEQQWIFEFPPEQAFPELQSFSDIVEILQILQQWRVKVGCDVKPRVISLRNGRYLRIQCKLGCKSYLAYKEKMKPGTANIPEMSSTLRLLEDLEGGQEVNSTPKQGTVWALYKWNNKHMHEKKAKQYVKLQKIIKQPSIKMLPKLKRQVCNQFKTIDKTFYKILLDDNNYYNVEIWKQLLEKGYEIYRSYQQISQIPSWIIITSIEMKKSYHQYGQFLRLHIPKIRIQNPSFVKKCQIIIAFGQNACGKQIPFALIMLLDPITNNYSNMLNCLLIQLGFLPLVIYTPNDKLQDIASKLAINKYPDIHILRQISDVIASKLQEIIHTPLQTYLKQLVTCKTIIQFQKNKKKFQSALIIANIPQLEIIIQKKDKFCFNQFPHTFLGLIMQFQDNKQLRKMIDLILKNNISYFTAIIKIVLAYEEIQKSAENIQILPLSFQEILGYEELYHLQPVMHCNVYKVILEQYLLTNSIKYSEINAESYLIEGVKVKQQIHNVKWQCECGFFDKIGIPCCHLMKVLMMKKIPLQEHINPRWIMANMEQQ